MPAKELRFGADARQRMQRGVDTLANAVRVPISVLRSVLKLMLSI